MNSGTSLIRRLTGFFYLLILLAGLAAVAVTGLFFSVVGNLPRVPTPLSRIIETPPTEIFSSTGERIMILGGREAIPLKRVSHILSRRFWLPRIIGSGSTMVWINFVP